MTETSEDATVAKANLVEHLKNIDAACDDARLSNLEKIRRIKEEVEKAQGCLKCQTASKFDPRSASNFDPLWRRALAVALAPSELVGVAETARARVGV